MTSKQIRQVRDALGLTLEELSRAMMVSWVSVWRWENGHAEKMDSLRRLVLEAVWYDLTRRKGEDRKRAVRRWSALAAGRVPAGFVAAALVEAVQLKRRRTR